MLTLRIVNFVSIFKMNFLRDLFIWVCQQEKAYRRFIEELKKEDNEGFC